MVQQIKLVIKRNNVTSNKAIINGDELAQITAKNNMQISLVDAITGKTPVSIQAKKSGNDLLVADVSGNDFLLVKNYYTVENIEIGTLIDSSFVNFEPIKGFTKEISSTSVQSDYTPLVTQMIDNTGIEGTETGAGLSDTGALYGMLGAVGIGIAVAAGSSDKDGKDGKDGAVGPQGQKGESGQDGKSAYEVAVEYGYKGSFEQWVTEMKGEDYVDPTNTPPSANDTNISTKEDVAFSGKLSPSTDSDGDELHYELNLQAKNGTAVVNKDGSFIYLPHKDYNGEDSFTYSISDGRGGVVTKIANINIDAINDAPESENTIINLNASEIMQAVEEGKTIKGQLVEATDVDGDDLVYFLGWYPGYRNLIVEEDGSYSIPPDVFLNYMIPNYGGSLNTINGEAIFSYVVSDGNGSQVIRDAILDFKNTAPVSNESIIEIEKDRIFEGDLNNLTNDPDRDQLTFKIEQQPLNGSVELDSSGRFKYFPNSGYTGSDTFSYIAEDGFEGVSILTANIVVSYNNNEPVSKDSYITINSDEVTKGKLEEATDIDGDVLEYAIEEQPNNGSVVIHADGRYEYQPNTGFNGVDKFTYTINDGYGGIITQTATVEVGNINHAPDSYVNREGTMTLDWSTGMTWRSPIFEKTTEDELLLIGYHENNFKLEKYNEIGELLFTINREDIPDSYGYLQVPLAATTTEDGKILILFGRNSNEKSVILRLNKDGSLDETFNPEGLGESIVGTIQLDYDFHPEKIFANSQGDIVVAGQANIAKFNSDGTIDTTFNTDGWLTGEQGVLQVGENKSLSGGQLLDSGNILTSSIFSLEELYLEEYDASGNLVNSLGTGYDRNSVSGLSDTIVLEQGKVLILFRTYSGLKIAKFNENFSEDESFNTNQEQVLNDLGFDKLIPEDMAVDSEGRILVNARGEFDDKQVQALFRFNSDGTLDESFNSNTKDSLKGLVLKEVDYGFDKLSFGLEVTSKGNIFVANKVDSQELSLSKYLNSGEISKDIGAHIDLQVSQNSTYVFQIDDFGFKDADGDSLKAIFIDEIPEKGELLLNGVAVTENQKVNAADIENGNLVFRPEKVIIQDDYASLTYRVQDDGGTENGAIDISHNQATLVIDVLPSIGPSSEVMVAAETYDTNTLLVNIENATINPYLYNDVSTDSSSQAGYSTWIEQAKSLPMLEDVLDVSESSEEQLFLNSNGKNSKEKLGTNELQSDGFSTLGLDTIQTSEFEKFHINDQVSYLI